MRQDSDGQGHARGYQNMVSGDGQSRNGADREAEQRAHMREMNAARQAAERRYAHARVRDNHSDRSTRLAAAQAREAAYANELARIDAEHQQWLVNQGIEVPARPQKKRAGAPPVPISGAVNVVDTPEGR